MTTDQLRTKVLCYDRDDAQHYQNGADRFEIGVIGNMTVDSALQDAALDMEFSNGGLFHRVY